jgi:hypothetical protein
MDSEKKLAYEAPHVEEFGSFEEITDGSKNGDALDAAFPAETPKHDLTFS